MGYYLGVLNHITFFFCLKSANWGIGRNRQPLAPDGRQGVLWVGADVCAVPVGRCWHIQSYL